MNLKKFETIKKQYENMRKEMQEAENAIRGSNNEISIKVWNTYCDYMGREKEKVFEINEENLSKLFKGLTFTEIFEMVDTFYFGIEDKYLRLDKDENLLSFNDAEEILPFEDIFIEMENNQEFYDKIVKIIKN